MPSVRTMNELRRVNEFHTYMGELKSMWAVYLDIVQVEGSLVVTDFDWVYFYRQWDGWEKDLAFERRMRS